MHVARDGANLGSFPREEVQEGLRTGKFLPTDMAWEEGMPDWRPLAQVMPEKSAAAPAAAPAGPTALPDASSSGPSGTGAGLPWDHRQSLGLVKAFFDTAVMVLTKPGEAFTAMKREGGFGEPLIYTVIGGSVGFAFYFLYNFFFTSLGGMLGNRENPLTHVIGTGIGSLFVIILVPFFAVIGAFIGAGILHLCLMIVGGAKQPFETTFRVVCFSGGSTGPLLVLPFCGGLIAGIWKIVLYCIGLARAHETDTGKAVMAVLLPIVVCCGGLMLLGILGGFSALSLFSKH